MALSTIERDVVEEELLKLPPVETDVAPAVIGPSHRRQALIGWAVLGVAIAIGFHQTFISIATQSYNGDPLVYLFLLPFWGVIVAAGTRLRRGPELAIHDRQIDWILAAGPLAAAIVMINVLVSPRLGVTAGLVRIDVFALILFAVFGSVLIFGSRTTGRYWASWALLLACWPLLYQLVGAALGGGTETFALLNVAISAAAVAIAIGGRFAPRLVSGAGTFLVGAAVSVLLHRSSLPTLADELVPAVVAPLAVLGLLWCLRRRSPGHRPAPAPRQLAVKKPFLSYGVVLVAGITLGLFSQLTPAGIAPSSLPQAGRAFMPQAIVPAGWQQGRIQHYPWASRYFGKSAALTRYWYTPASSGPTKPSGPTQRIVVDTLNAPATGPLSVYPAIAIYKLASPYIQSPTPVALGHHVEGTLFYANPYTAVDPVQTEWVLLTWTQRVEVAGRTTFQRLSVITTDGTPATIAFPKPTSPWSNGTVRNVFQDALRGLPTQSSTGPGAAAENRLTTFARHLVADQTPGAHR